MLNIIKARVFMSGRSQAVRIPARYRFSTEEVYLQHDPQSGTLTLSERQPAPPLEEIFAQLDAAGARTFAQDMIDDRSSEPAAERDWMR
jgi:antitoxin VapB